MESGRGVLWRRTEGLLGGADSLPEAGYHALGMVPNLSDYVTSSSSAQYAGVEMEK